MYINTYLFSNSFLYKELCNLLSSFLRKEKYDLDLEKIRLMVYQEWHKHNYIQGDRIFDTHWDNLQNRKKEENNSLSLAILGQACRYYLTTDNQFINVKSSKFGEWQNWLANQSALPVIAFKLVSLKNFGINKHFRNRYESINYIKSILGYNSLLSPYHPLVEDYIDSYGLNETHLHLNGTTSLEHIWLKGLNNPKLMADDLKAENSKEHVSELYASDPVNKSPEDYYSLLVIAKLLRKFIGTWINKSSKKEIGDDKEIKNITKSLCCYLTTLNEGAIVDRAFIIEKVCDETYLSNLYEVEFHMRVIEFLKTNQSTFLDLSYLLYMVCMNCFLKLAVQSEYQKSFDQFQKIADDGIRESIEKEYYSRYCQFHGSNLAAKPMVMSLEGRFAPKKSVAKNEEILRQILFDFVKYAKGKHYTSNKDLNFLVKEVLSIERPKLRLVAHFIKMKWSRKKDAFHFETLRATLLQNSHFLFRLFDKYPSLKAIITGFDAAANEIDAPPEVFAQLYRYSRKKGIKHFTYHVGEDFIHLLSGIRAIYDAILFLGLKNSDRIGHGTAIGILPEYWLNHMPDKIFISRGQWLENLIFARQIALEHDEYDIPMYRIEAEIDQLSKVIFSEELDSDISTSLLHQVFNHRYLDPCVVKMILAENSESSILNSYTGWLYDEYLKTKKIDTKALEYLDKRWSDKKVIDKYEEQIEIDTNFFSAEILLKIQQYVQKIIFDKEIVVETLPTSNVRISLYKSITEHHVFRWLQIPERKIEGDYPMLVALGSDDPGIFATDIKNEFYHIFTTLVHTFNYSPNDALEIAKKLNENGRIYMFSSEDYESRLEYKDKLECGFAVFT